MCPGTPSIERRIPNVKEFGYPMTPDDRKLWHWFIQYVQPLKKKNTITRALPPPPAAPVRSTRPLVKLPLRSPSTLREPILAPLDRKLRRARATGRMTLDGTLDLHGLTQDQAYSALASFLDRAFQEQKRFVLIITGKGKSTRDDTPATGVLKRNLPLWLSHHERFPYILFLKPAARLDGGDGAWYVGLKKNRSQG